MKSFPWNSIIDGIDEETGFPIYDRPYDAEDFRDVMQRFFSDGIFSDTPLGFSVTAGSGMTVNVDGGACIISGTTGVEKESRTLMVQAADKNNPRIDTVVLRWNADIDERNIDLYIVSGKAAQNPTRPELTRIKGSVWELGLCDILIPTGSYSISNSNMTDTRLDPTRCGIVTPFAEFDSSMLYKVASHNIDELKSVMKDELQKQTDTAVNLAKAALDGTTAGHLQNQIDEINDYTTGINLVKGTRDFTEGRITIEGGSSYIFTDGFGLHGEMLNRSTYIDKSGFTVTKLSRSGLLEDWPFVPQWVDGIYTSYINNDNSEDGKYTVSFEFMIEDMSAFEGNYICLVANDKENRIGFSDFGLDRSEIASGRWYKVSKTVDVPLTTERFSCIFGMAKNGVISFRKIKVERGAINKPIWSASPFDVVQKNDISANIPNIVHGIKSITVKDGNIATPVEFKTAFPYPPIVVITPDYNAGSNSGNITQAANIGLYVSDVTKNGFNIRSCCSGAPTWSISMQINWVAFGV